MIKKKLKGLDIDVCYEKLDNGLRVFIVPYKGRKNYYLNFCTKYGAEIEEFVSVNTGKKTKKPYGVAHFLEHKMFDQEDGTDPLIYFSESGTDANASTGYRVTSYTVEGINDFEKNLTYLIDYINSPFFTDENVEKEKGIIIEELNMYKDQPENILFEKSNEALFQKHPMRIDVGGTVSSVKKITKEILTDCYDTFYQPSNMFLVILGDIDPEKTLNLIKSNKKLNSKPSLKPVQVFKSNEPLEVNEKEKIVKIKNLVLPKFILNFKSPVKNMEKEEKYKYLLCSNILLYILFGMSSEFREEMLRKENYSLFYYSEIIIDDLFIIEFVAESKKPEELKQQIFNCLKNQKIKEEDVERVKKVKLALQVIDSDKPYRVMDTVVEHIIEFDDIIYNKVDLLREITLEDIENVRNNILMDNYSYVLGIKK